MILEIKNNYTYLIEGNMDILDTACTLQEDYVYQQVFLLKHKSNSKYHINSYDGSFNAAKSKANKLGYNFMIPIKYTKKYKKSKRLIKAPVFKKKDIRFFDMKNKKFPTGWLFNPVIRTLKQFDISYKLIDKRNMSKPKPLNKELPYELRYYQKDAVNLAKNSHRGILELATGAGKTLIAMAIINELGYNTLFIVPSLEILKQSYRRFSKVFGKNLVGQIGDNILDINKITISTVQSLWSKRKEEKIQKLLNSVNILILDEAHHTNISKQSSTNTWYKIAMQCTAEIRIGLTATPGKDNDLNYQMLKAVTGKVGIKKTLKNLIDEEFLVPADVYMPTIKIKSYSHWKTSMKKGIYLNDERNNKIAQLATYYKNKNKKVLITVNRIETQAKELLNFLPNSLFAFGETSSSDRDEIFEEFKKSNQGKILISSVVNEGFDVPSIEVLIRASAGKGGQNNRGRSIIQEVGRALRLSKGKEKAIIIDFYDKDNSTLEKHSKIRLRTYKRPNVFNIIKKYPKED